MNSSVRMPIGYTNKMLIGDELSSQWKEQLETNDSLKKVMQMNQDDAEVDKILNDQNQDNNVQTIGEASEDEKPQEKDDSTSRTQPAVVAAKLENKLT